jgi:histidinol-phosphate phosphatase family protein
MNMELKQLIDPSWTLFLDRDGVINHEKKADYIRNVDEFVFYDGIPEAIALLSPLFQTIVIVTNQKGVGRGWMTLADLDSIHQHMLTVISAAGGRIDKIYFCPDTDSDSPNRKPNPGMAFQAKADFPQIDFAKSLMVGNKLSDMNFGRNAGINTVFVATTNPEIEFPHPAIDARFDNLPALAHYLTKP